jgi:hypothetical protein
MTIKNADDKTTSLRRETPTPADSVTEQNSGRNPNSALSAPFRGGIEGTWIVFG